MIYNIFYNFLGANKALFIFINNVTNVSILPYFLKIISQIFFIGNFPIYYFLLCGYCWWMLRKNPKDVTGLSSGARNNVALHNNDFTHIFNQLFKLGMCYALFGFLYAGLKFGINLPRPFCSLPADIFITIINTAEERCLSSFPSAHTGLAVIITYYLWPYLKNYQKAFAILLIILAAISRITLAMHYPADILYSMAIAFGLIFLNETLFKLLYKNLIEQVKTMIFKLLF